MHIGIHRIQSVLTTAAGALAALAASAALAGPAPAEAAGPPPSPAAGLYIENVWPYAAWVPGGRLNEGLLNTLDEKIQFTPADGNTIRLQPITFDGDWTHTRVDLGRSLRMADGGPLAIDKPGTYLWEARSEQMMPGVPTISVHDPAVWTMRIDVDDALHADAVFTAPDGTRTDTAVWRNNVRPPDASTSIATTLEITRHGGDLAQGGTRLDLQQEVFDWEADPGSDRGPYTLWGPVDLDAGLDSPALSHAGWRTVNTVDTPGMQSGDTLSIPMPEQIFGPDEAAGLSTDHPSAWPFSGADAQRTWWSRFRVVERMPDDPSAVLSVSDTLDIVCDWHSDHYFPNIGTFERDTAHAPDDILHLDSRPAPTPETGITGGIWDTSTGTPAVPDDGLYIARLSGDGPDAPMPDGCTGENECTATNAGSSFHFGTIHWPPAGEGFRERHVYTVTLTRVSDGTETDAGTTTFALERSVRRGDDGLLHDTVTMEPGEGARDGQVFGFTIAGTTGTNNDTDDNDGNGTDDHDDNGTDDHDNTGTDDGTDNHDSNSTDDHDDTGTDDHDNTGTDDHDNTGTDDHDNTGTDDHDNTGTDDHDNTGTDDHDNTGTDDGTDNHNSNVSGTNQDGGGVGSAGHGQGAPPATIPAAPAEQGDGRSTSAKPIGAITDGPGSTRLSTYGKQASNLASTGPQAVPAAVAAAALATTGTAALLARRRSESCRHDRRI